MSKQWFHLGDVLSITTGRLVSLDGIRGVYNILNHMTGESLSTHQLPRADDVCRPHLISQFPQLDPEDQQMQFEIGRLIEMLASTSGQEEPQELVIGWLVEMTKKYGETFEVESLPAGAYQHRDPTEEAEAMFGKGRVAVIQLPADPSLS